MPPLIVGSREDIEEISPWVEKGKAWAQKMLGDRYDLGVGVDQSDQRAKELWELAARQGDSTAQYLVQSRYYECMHTTLELLTQKLCTCTIKVKVWIKITNELKNITSQQQSRDMLMRRTIWEFSMQTV